MKFTIWLVLHAAVLLACNDCFAQSFLRTREPLVIGSRFVNAPNQTQGVPPKLKFNLNLTLPAPVPSMLLELDPVTVYGKRDFLTESDARLFLLTSALPCIGCNGHLKAKRSIAEVTSLYAEDVVIYALSHLIFRPPPPAFDDPADAALYFSNQEPPTSRYDGHPLTNR